MLFRNFNTLSLDEHRIEALAVGEAYDDKKHPIKTTLKGATYHQLRIFRKGDLWVGEVILDI
jgi:SHS2 domain-containing protein